MVDVLYWIPEEDGLLVSPQVDLDSKFVPFQSVYESFAYCAHCTVETSHYLATVVAPLPEAVALGSQRSNQSQRGKSVSCE